MLQIFRQIAKARSDNRQKLVLLIALSLGAAGLTQAIGYRQSSLSHSRNYFPGGMDTGRLFLACRDLASKRLPYRFGGSNPGAGGMDCSGTVRWVMRSMGQRDIPRTAYDQYRWLSKQGMIYSPRSTSDAVSQLRPGYLLFWSGTYRSSKPITHVMIYAGYDQRTGKHMVFGAKGKTKRGVNGAGVDFFKMKLDLGGSTNFAGYAPVPGFRYY